MRQTYIFTHNLMTLMIFFIKSLISGVYINKDSIILMMVIAFILSTTFKNKFKILSQETVENIDKS